MKDPRQGGNDQLRILLSIDARTGINHRRLLHVAGDHIYRQSFIRTAQHLVEFHGLDGIDREYDEYFI